MTEELLLLLLLLLLVLPDVSSSSSVLSGFGSRWIPQARLLTLAILCSLDHPSSEELALVTQ